MFRVAVLVSTAGLATLAAACSGGDHGADLTDAPAAVDAPAGDAPAPVDAPATVPLPGFGIITGQCGVLHDAELDGTTPLWFGGDLDFANNRYDDPAERDELTAGGRHLIETANAGGSSIYSEAFAFEWLARCEGATLLATETEITYDVAGKKADMLVDIAGRKVGVSVTRFVMFPFGTDYTPATATTLIARKIDDLAMATTEVSAADHWTRQLVIAEAYNAQHAQVAMDAWAALDAQARGNAIFIVAVTDGDDLFIYTDM